MPRQDRISWLIFRQCLGKALAAMWKWQKNSIEKAARHLMCCGI